MRTSQRRQKDSHLGRAPGDPDRQSAAREDSDVGDDQGDGEGTDENRARAARRSRTNVRRYCQHNGLTHMPTLTYATPAESIDQISEDVRNLRRRLLRASWGPAEAFPYLWAMERGKQGTERLHVHMAVGSWWTDSGCVEVCEACSTVALRAKRGTTLARSGSACWGCLWGHGFVGAPSEGTDDPRSLAGYVSKYVGKSLGDDLAQGRQTYRVGEGFRPKPLRLEVDSVVEAGAHLHELAGDSALVITALHEKYEDWAGPATWSVRWE
jgi:hypothetical protein